MSNSIIPQHIAFIMDGNRRWARERQLPLISGHHKGAEKIEPLVAYAAKRGISYITFWAFSSENWERGKSEIGFLMRVFREFIKGSVVNRMMEKGVRVKIIGDIESFPKDIIKGVNEIVDRSRNNTTITATFALNYGGRKEILSVVNGILEEYFTKDSKSDLFGSKIKDPADAKAMAGRQKSKIKNKFQNSKTQISKQYKYINEKMFSSYLYTKDLPDPDMIVRTGGERRLSGFLPWQGVYSELYFTDKYWPDFDEKAFEEALEEYGNRERRFGR